VVFPAFFAFVFKERKRAVFMTAAFTLGIILSFITMGIVAGFVGTFFNEVKREFAWLSGALLIFFGILMLLNKGFTFLTFKMDHPDRKRSFMSMVLLGFFFALGWTPCVGPILAGILVLAANTGAVLTSAMMLFAYGVGVAVPLLLVAWLSDKYDFARWMQRGHLQFKLFGKTVHTHAYNIVGGLLLIGVGVVIFAYRGSQEIERVIVEFTPWKMNWLYGLNDAVLASPLTSGIANIVGIVVLFGIMYLVWRALRRPGRAAKFK
jgi:cytochrome c biogenesis protein CcdA